MKFKKQDFVSPAQKILRPAKRNNKIYIDEAARVSIGDNYRNVPFYRIFFGVPVVYLPLFLFPIVMLSSWLTWLHLKMIGAQNVFTYKDFLPDRKSFRYTFKTQIIMEKRHFFSTWSRSVIFWMFNCTGYCPYSVALFQWHTYLVKVVENFWCPFYHDKKMSYGEGAIDKSYWHQNEVDKNKLHPEDQNNPIWNKNFRK
ncbi:MAG: hypothetical protein OEV66_01725 [Spirochaetia bacterium]|nr:hypothetical protein [Spirochaetia bacterium]